MSMHTKTSARSVPRKRASSGSSVDRPYVRRSAVRALIERKVKNLGNKLGKEPDPACQDLLAFCINTLYEIEHDLETL